MIKCLLGCQSNICGPLQKFVDEVLGVIGDLAPYLTFHAILSIEYTIYNIFILFTTKWWLTAKHDIHYNAHRPNITLCCIAPFKDLRCNIVWCSIWLVHYFIRINSLRKTKVNQFDMGVIIFLIQEEVLWFDISVANSIFMQVAQCIKCLFHYTRCLLFSQMLLLGDMVEELATLAKPTMNEVKIKSKNKKMK